MPPGRVVQRQEWNRRHTQRTQRRYLAGSKDMSLTRRICDINQQRPGRG